MRHLQSLDRSRYLLVILIALTAGLIVLTVAVRGELQRQNVGAEAPVELNVAEWGSLKDIATNTLELDAATQLRHYQVTMALTNISDSVIQFSPGLQVFIVTETGERTVATAKFLDPKTVIGGPIANGGTWQGTLDFELSDTAMPLKIVIEKDASSRTIEGQL